jgi:hypothetical protein
VLGRRSCGMLSAREGSAKDSLPGVSPMVSCSASSPRRAASFIIAVGGELVVCVPFGDLCYLCLESWGGGEQLPLHQTHSPLHNARGRPRPACPQTGQYARGGHPPKG